jgi:hypothetical protein
LFSFSSGRGNGIEAGSTSASTLLP